MGELARLRASYKALQAITFINYERLKIISQRIDELSLFCRLANYDMYAFALIYIKQLVSSLIWTS
jgi:hypothetical protein